jgi:hypothetical protein
MSEDYVETRCLRNEGDGQGEWVALGHNTSRTGYQLRSTLDLQAQALCARLA